MITYHSFFQSFRCTGAILSFQDNNMWAHLLINREGWDQGPVPGAGRWVPGGEGCVGHCSPCTTGFCCVHSLKNVSKPPGHQPAWSVQNMRKYELDISEICTQKIEVIQPRVCSRGFCWSALMISHTIIGT